MKKIMKYNVKLLTYKETPASTRIAVVLTKNNGVSYFSSKKQAGNSCIINTLQI